MHRLGRIGISSILKFSGDFNEFSDLELGAIYLSYLGNCFLQKLSEKYIAKLLYG